MTLQEAVKSGKPFRFKGNDKWYSANQVAGWKVSVTDALADNWEIQQKETFTRADVERAIMKTIELCDEYHNEVMGDACARITYVKAMTAADSGDEK